MDDALGESGDQRLARIILRTNGFLYRCRNDADYSMIYMDGAVQALTGYAADEFLHPPARSFSAAIHPDDRDRVIARVDAAVAARNNWTVDYRFIRQDGTDQWVQESGGGVFDASGALIYLEGIVLDHSVGKAEELFMAAMQAELAAKCRLLLQDTEPVTKVLRLLRLLAINARIEAARAGQAGAGFAVVAAEIGRLAEETTERATRMAEVTRDLNGLLAQE